MNNNPEKMNRINFSIKYLSKGLENLKDERFYNDVYATMLIELIIELFVCNMKEELESWINITKDYYEKYQPSPNDNESLSNKHYNFHYQFMISVICNEYNISYAQRLCRILSVNS